jgi:hypothetical protein
MKRMLLLIVVLCAFALAQESGDYGSMSSEEKNQFLQQNVASGLTQDIVTVSGSTVTLTRSPGKALELQAGYSGEFVMNGKSADIVDKSGQAYSLKSATKVVVVNGVVQSIQNAHLAQPITLNGVSVAGEGISYDFKTGTGTVRQDNSAARISIDGVTYVPDHGKELFIDGKASPPAVSGKSFSITKTYGPIDVRRADAVHERRPLQCHGELWKEPLCWKV